MRYPCGKGDDMPRCMGSAARGWEYCTCSRKSDIETLEQAVERLEARVKRLELAAATPTG